MRVALPSILCLSLVTSAASAAPPVALTSAECAVWQREQSFARSVAAHDALAFAEHVHEQAAFGVGTPAPTRGREAIAQRWQGLIKGKTVRLEWYPARVTIAGVGDVAWSTGPALYEDLDPKAEHRFLISHFQSVWHRDADGVWRVLFDDGTQSRPANRADIEAFRAGRADCRAG